MNSKLSTHRRKNLFLIILLTLFGGLMYASQVIMASLPNIEIISLLIIILTRKFSYKALVSVYIFVLCEILTYGLSMWVLNYLYVWLILVVIVCLIRKIDNVFVYAIVSAIYGLFFGTLCSIPYLLTMGAAGALAYIINGISFDLIHCAGNFLLVLLLYIPLTRVFDKTLKPFI